MHFRYAFRALRRSPGFSATVILTLALGIGAGTAVFGALDRLLLRPLPYSQPDRLVALHETQPAKTAGTVSLANLYDIKTQSKTLSVVAGFMTRSFGLREGSGPVHVVMTGMVTSDLFEALGARPRLGRAFSEKEERQGDALIVLTDELWASLFHRTPGLLGQTVQLNEQPYQVIGILPPGMVFPEPGRQVDAYIPISHRDYGSRAVKPLQAIARLQPAATLAAAQAELRTLGSRLAADYPVENRAGGASLESLDNEWKGNLRRPLRLLTIAALLLLAIVCTNVVNLILTRALARSREMDTRRALGARWWNIAAQLLSESLLLCVAGGAAGIGIAIIVLRALATVIGQPVPQLQLDGGMFAFAAAICFTLTLICGFAPALSSGRAGWPVRARRAFVIAQVALSLVLLLSAGAFLRVFVNLANRYPGFDSTHVAYFGFGLPEGRYDDRKMVDFHRQLHHRLREIPGVEAAGAAWRLPLNGKAASTSFQFEGAGIPPGDWPAVAFNMVDPDYIDAMRIPLLAGRRLSWERDSLGHAPAILVNRAFAQAYGAVVGRRVQLRFFTDVAPKGQLWEVAGVVGDTYQAALDQDIRPQIYLPVSQTGLDGGVYLLRTTRADADLAAAASAAVRAIDPDLERIQVRRLDNWVSQSLGDRRLPATLSGVFAAIGLSLTVLGLYGTLSLEVGQRRKEIAIRVALGASNLSITKLIVSRGVLLMLAGVGAGAALFVFAAPAIQAQLYQVSPADPLHIAIVMAILFVCTLAATVSPARRALAEEPISILRE